VTTRRVSFDSSLGHGKTTFDERVSLVRLHQATTSQSTPADAWAFVWFAREIHIARNAASPRASSIPNCGTSRVRSTSVATASNCSSVQSNSEV